MKSITPSANNIQFAAPARAAAITQIPENTIRRLIKRGICPGFYTGSRFMVNIPALCEWLNNQTAGSTKEDNHGQ